MNVFKFFLTRGSKLSCSEWNENTLFSFLAGLPTTERSTNRFLFTEPKVQRKYTTTVNIDNKDYISKAVSGTKLNIVNVFNYEFPTQILSSGHCLLTILFPEIDRQNFIPTIKREYKYSNFSLISSLLTAGLDQPITEFHCQRPATDRPNI